MDIGKPADETRTRGPSCFNLLLETKFPRELPRPTLSGFFGILVVQHPNVDNCKTTAAEDAVKSGAALALESLMKALHLLVPSAADGMAVGKVGEVLEAPPAMPSFHLKELVQAGPVAQQRHGRWIIYILHYDSVCDLMAFFRHDRCQGRPKLGQPDFAQLKKIGRKAGKQERSTN